MQTIKTIAEIVEQLRGIAGELPANSKQQNDLDFIAGELAAFQVLVHSYDNDDDSGTYIMATLGFPATILTTSIHDIYNPDNAAHELEGEFRHEWGGVTVRSPEELRAMEADIEAEIDAINEGEDENE